MQAFIRHITQMNFNKSIDHIQDLSVYEPDVFVRLEIYFGEIISIFLGNIMA